MGATTYDITLVGEETEERVAHETHEKAVYFFVFLNYLYYIGVWRDVNLHRSNGFKEVVIVVFGNKVDH